MVGTKKRTCPIFSQWSRVETSVRTMRDIGLTGKKKERNLSLQEEGWGCVSSGQSLTDLHFG